MATRSTIAILKEDGTRHLVYCHWDGYPSNNGSLLLEHYNTEEKVLELVSMGDLSSLRPNVNIPEGKEHNFDNSLDDVCIFYGRDRGDKGYETKIYTKSEKMMTEEYNYLFKNGEWFCSVGERNSFTPLTQKECGE